MAKNNEIATVHTSDALAVITERPEWLKDSGQALGNEDVEMQDIILPRIDILQALSPQIKSRDPKYIEGAKQGDMFNTVTGELLGESVQFIPVKFAKEWIIWQDRNTGGGFKGSFSSIDEAEAAQSALDNPDQHEVVETHVHYVLIVRENGHLEEAVLSLAKSKRKVSKTLNTLVMQAQGDRFSRRYTLSAAEASGPKGDYWTFAVKAVGYVTQPQYEAAKRTYEAIVGGERKIDREDHGDEEGAAGGSAVV